MGYLEKIEERTAANAAGIASLRETINRILAARSSCGVASEILAGRDRLPTLHEIRTHEDQGGSGWWVHESGGLWHMQVLNGEIYCAGPQRATQPPRQGRWWCWNKGPVAWPEVAP